MMICKPPSIHKVIGSMLKYKHVSLIPCSLPTMCRIFTSSNDNPNVTWHVKGRPPLLSNETLMAAVGEFKRDVGRAVGSDDMKVILKDAKKYVAELKGTSNLLVLHLLSVLVQTTCHCFNS